MTSLRANVFVAPAVPMKSPGGKPAGTWSPIACTLIHGPTSAVLVNTPFTIAETSALADWIARTIPDKKLIGIYISHGFGDFFFGLPTLRKRFPEAKTYATQTTLDMMKAQVTPKAYKSFAGGFPGLVDEPIPAGQLGEALPASNEIILDGQVLKAITVGQAAVANSTILWVPSLRLAVCGTVLYGDVHQMVANLPAPEKRQAWIKSIEAVEALSPTSVVPAHMKEGEVPGLWHIANTKQYLQTLEAILSKGQAKSAKELSQAMLQKYPHRFNSGALVATARALVPNKGKM